MPRFLTFVLLLSGCLVCAPAQVASKGEAPKYTPDGGLLTPADYREWIFLSSGLGMTYSATHGAGAAFTNVFVNPGAYRAFLATGHWPDKTLLILEIRSAANKGSINQSGSYQSDLLAVEGEVKDRAKFPEGGWAFFTFGKSPTGKLLPRTQDCYSCHAEHGAVDNTFVQFYPVLLDVAKQKGTLKSSDVAR